MLHIGYIRSMYVYFFFFVGGGRDLNASSRRRVYIVYKNGATFLANVKQDDVDWQCEE